MTSIVTEVTDFCSSQFFWALRSSRKSLKDYQCSRIFLGDCRRQVAAIYCATARFQVADRKRSFHFCNLDSRSVIARRLPACTSRKILGDCFGSRDFLGDCSVGLCRGIRTSYTFSPVPIPNAESTIRFTPGSKELAARSRQALPFLLLPLHLPWAACAGSLAFPRGVDSLP